MQHEGRGEERNGEEQGTSYLEPIVFFLILPEGILTSQQPFNGGMGEDRSDRESVLFFVPENWVISSDSNH